MEQHPLLYVRQVDQDFAVTLRPRAQRSGGYTLDASLSDIIQDLAQVEIQLAQYASETEAPTELVAERDRLLAVVV